MFHSGFSKIQIAHFLTDIRILFQTNTTVVFTASGLARVNDIKILLCENSFRSKLWKNFHSFDETSWYLLCVWICKWCTSVTKYSTDWVTKVRYMLCGTCGFYMIVLARVVAFSDTNFPNILKLYGIKTTWLLLCLS